MVLAEGTRVALAEASSEGGLRLCLGYRGRMGGQRGWEGSVGPHWGHLTSQQHLWDGHRVRGHSEPWAVLGWPQEPSGSSRR